MLNEDDVLRRMEAEAEANAMTEASVKEAIVALGKEPSPSSVQSVLEKIALIEDVTRRAVLFATAGQSLKGKELKGLVAEAQSNAKKTWAARKKYEAQPGGKKSEPATSNIPLPYWGTRYAKHQGRTFVWGKPREDVDFDVPLHSPLRLRSSVVFPDRKVQRREKVHGVTIEFEGPSGELRTLSFQQSQALAPTTHKDGMIQDLTNAGVAVTTTGIEQLRAGILAAGGMGVGGLVFDWPGWRGPDFFLTPGGKVIGKTNLDIILSHPLSGIREAGTLDGWRKATAAAFCDEVVEKAPHVPATILFGGASPLADRAEEEMSFILSLAGKTTRLKTYSLRMQASMWGVTLSKENGEKGLEGVVVTFNATPNQLERYAAERSGTGVCNDDTTLANPEVLGSYLYRLASGTTRGRMNEGASGWTLGLVITSEVPILQYLRSGTDKPPAPGMMSRVVEINIEDNRVSDGPVDTMGGAFENYGHAGPAFVEAMLAGGWDKAKIVTAVKDRQAKLLGGVGEREQGRRAARGVAFIWLSGDIAQEAKLIPADFDVAKFAQALWEKVKGGSDTTTTLFSRIVNALALGLREGSIPIHTNQGIAVSTVPGVGAVCHLALGRDDKPAFALSNSALAAIIGARDTVSDAVKLLDEEGALLRQQDDRLSWKPGRAGVGEVPAYVIHATAVLGEDAEEIISQYWNARRASGPAQPESPPTR